MLSVATIGALSECVHARATSLRVEKEENQRLSTHPWANKDAVPLYQTLDDVLDKVVLAVRVTDDPRDADSGLAV